MGCGDLRGLGLSFRKGLRCLQDLGGFRVFLDPPKRLKCLLFGEKQFFAVRLPQFLFSSAFSENCTKHRQSHGSDDAFCRPKRAFSRPKRAFCRPPVSEKHCERTFLTESMLLWTATKICVFSSDDCCFSSRSLEVEFSGEHQQRGSEMEICKLRSHSLQIRMHSEVREHAPHVSL